MSYVYSSTKLRVAQNITIPKHWASRRHKNNPLNTSTTPSIMPLAHPSHCFLECLSPSPTLRQSPQSPLATKSRISHPLPAVISAETRMMLLIIAPPLLAVVRKENGVVVDAADGDMERKGKVSGDLVLIEISRNRRRSEGVKNERINARQGR